MWKLPQKLWVWFSVNPSCSSGKVWLAGILMAAPLSIPLVNLVIPVLGVATFTHLFHRLAGKIR
jgi:uncharacterized protein involved in cysteine biosynthesis